jgi:beta-phosphoglucomutase
MKYQAIIFDLDGVLISTDRCHYEAWESIARELGIPFDEKVNNQLRGVSRMESLELILKGHIVLGEQEKIVLTDKKNTRYRSLLETLTPAAVDRDVLVTLQTLKEKGIKLAIGSSSKNAQFILQKTGLAVYFDAVSDGTMIKRTKPDPEVFLKAAELLSATVSDSLVVEDAHAGIEAAAAGGFDSAGIGDAASSALCTYRLAKLSDLLVI